MKVNAVVVNWRQPALTEAAVASLEAQDGLDGIDLTITVVDNGSADGSAERLERRYAGSTRHRVLALAANGGFGAGANAGIRAVDAAVHVLLNNDAEAGPGFVRALVDALGAHPEAGAVTARIVLRERYRRLGAGEAEPAGTLHGHDGARWTPDEQGVELLNSTGNEVTRTGNGRDRDWLRPVADGADGTDGERAAGEAPGFSGGAVALRQAALAQTGLFDESLFMYYEDTDLSWRLRRAGWRIRYAPAAVARHAHAASSGTGSESFRLWNERNRIVVAAKNAPLPVLARALLRTAARRRGRSLAAAVRRLPAALGERRRVDRDAVVDRMTAARALAAEAGA